MINRISANSVNRNNGQPFKNEPQFKGLSDLFLAPIQLCETQPMVNVAVADLATAIIPRTIVEGETNPYAGLEAFRRESSGLIINCMIPGVIVLGVAKAAQRFAMGEGSKMANCWANEDTINMIKYHWEKALNLNDDAISNGKIIYQKGSNEAKVYNTIKNILTDIKGIDGKNEVDLKNFNFDESIHQLTEEVLHPKKKARFLSQEWFDNRKAVEAAKKAAEAAGIEYVKPDAFSQIVNQTKVNNNIKFKEFKLLDKKRKVIDGYFSQSLGDILGNTPKILRELLSNRFKNADTFASRAKNLLTAKSLGGLALILPLAITAQPINRWITQKTSGKKGAPIYKDFTQTESKELTSKEKAALFGQKLISVGSIVGVALLSIGKLPGPQMFKNIAQFKGIFPSMDQARLISTATFASRMMASQDRNDLREATSRDIATFCTFYFLGDYVAKGVASFIQKVTKGTSKEVTLINVLKEKSINGNSFWHWAKDTALKSSDEVYGKTAEATKYAKKMRSVCQLANLAFQLVTLGIIIPKMYRKKTEKEHEKELKALHNVKTTVNK